MLSDPELRDRVLEADSFFTAEGLPFAKRTWNRLLLSFEELKEDGSSPAEAATFIKRVVLNMAGAK